MLARIMYVVMLAYSLSACVQKKSEAQQEGDISNKPLSANCLHARQELDKAVQAGERDSLHELKRNIEIYCVWRRY